MAKGNSVKIRIDGDASDLEKKLKNIGNTAKAGLADVKAGIDLATQAIGKLADVAGKGINYNATIERLKTSFEVMTGSAEKAVEVVDHLRVMGAETPFETKDLASTTQLLMQYGINADTAIDRMKMLGDIAQGNVNDMNSIALAYAQMTSAGKVNLVDIKQMITGGFNPLREISERTGESMASLYNRISKDTLAIEEITDSMRYATSEGGRFYQSMEKQSQTLNGQLSTLRDNADQLLGSLTEGVSEGLRTQLLPFANNLVAELQGAFDAGGYQGLVDTATDMIPDLLGMMTGELQKGIEGLSRWLPRGATQLMQALPSALHAVSTVTPQLTQALFEVASAVVFDLVAMLPELAPIVVEGFANTFGAALEGAYKLLTSLFTGIEQAFHQGQTKIAGVWVDDTNLAKYKFDLEADIEPATTEIETAYSNIRAALKTDLLTDEQKAEIEKMIGDDYDAVKAKLMSFGVSEEESAAIASVITESGAAIKAQIDALDIGVDSGTVMKWIAQAGGSRIRLKTALKQTALDESDQAEVIGLFDSMTSNITGALPDVVEEIYNTLTNGNAEDDDKKTLTQKLDDALGDDIEEVNKWLEDNVGNLDKDSATYEADVAALTEEAAAYQAEIKTLHAEMVALVDSLAGQPTAVVEARMAEFADIEARLAEINAEIDATSAKARSAEEAAFQVVRSGAQADEATVSQAISFKVNEFKLEEQSAEDAYDAIIQDLNMQYANGEMGEIQYNARVNTEISQLEDSKAEALRKYEAALGEIFRGIAESEGIEKTTREAAEKMDLGNALVASTALLDADSEGVLGDKLGEELTGIIAQGLEMSPEALKMMQTSSVSAAISDWATNLFTEAAEMIEGLDNTKLQEAYQAALESGALFGTSFDTEGGVAQLAALLGSMYTSAAESAGPEAQAASAALLTDAETGAAGSEASGRDLGGDWGSGYVSGIRAWINAAYSAAYSVARAAVQGGADGQNSASPSKDAMDLGHDYGDGYAIGIEESMRNAVRVAKRMTGEVVTAASLTQNMRVTVPGMQADVQSVLEQTERPVNLYVNGRQLGRVMAADNQQAQNSYNRSIALGVGK